MQFITILIDCYVQNNEIIKANNIFDQYLKIKVVIIIGVGMKCYIYLK